jgi:hypothetical protein
MTDEEIKYATAFDTARAEGKPFRTRKTLEVVLDLSDGTWTRATKKRKQRAPETAPRNTTVRQGKPGPKQVRARQLVALRRRYESTLIDA